MIFQISGINLNFHTSESLKITDNFNPFHMGAVDANPIYDVYFQEVSHFPIIEGKNIYYADCYKVLQIDDDLLRFFFEPGHVEEPYALGMYNFDLKKISILYKQSGKKHFSEIGSSFFHIAWESLLMYENRLILHSSCIHTKYGGILFSGNSGIGKSTQAELWIKYQDAKLINGDRTILHLDKQNIWKGYGSPYAGSSRCYKNESTNIRAIVFLKQDKKCYIRSLSSIEAYKKIYSQLTVNSWDKSYMTKMCYLIEKIIKNVEIYELACTPEKEAVDLLAETLKGDGY